MARAHKADAWQYATLKYVFTLVDIFFSLGLVFFALVTGASASLESLVRSNVTNPSLVLPLYLGAGFLIFFLISLPLHFFRSYTLEHRFSLSSQRLGDWCKDQLKGALLSFLLLLICAEAFYFILAKSPSHWWFVISIFWIFFNLILAKLVPVLVIPLFFKYKKLTDEVLVSRIKALARKMRVGLLDVFEIDFSKKTRKANAAFVGWGATRRVIIADTLKNNFSQDEIEVVLAHEFAHFRLRHLLKFIFASAAITLASFYLIFRTNQPFLHWVGFSSLTQFAAFPAVVLYLLVIDIVITPAQNALSRRFETHADRMALQATGNKAAFISAMEKLASQNLADRKPHPLIRFFFFDHPPIEERIALAKGA